MSEINNTNIPSQLGVKSSRIQPNKPVDEEASSIESENCCCPQCEITPDQGVLGRSQVKEADNIDSDLKFLEKNLGLVKKCNEYSDEAYEALAAEGDPNAYENSCVLSDGFRKEFAN